MKLTMLGTGCAVVTDCYNTCYVLSENNKHLLVDGGGGSGLLHQLKAANIPVNDIHEIFVTHKHIDHILGIVWLIRVIGQNMNKGTYQGDAWIYGHDEVIRILRSMSETLLQTKVTRFIDDRIHLVTVTDGEEKTILDKKVTFFDIHSSKDKQFGYCMDLGDGKRLTCCGDEPYNEYELDYVKDCTWLLHEAFCLYSEADIFSPYEKHHSTVKDACELATQMHVTNLLLYHTEDKHIQNRKDLYTKEGARYFHGSLFIPDDLEVLDL